MMSWRSKCKRWSKWLAGGTVVLAVLLAVLFALIQTPWTKRHIARILSAQLTPGIHNPVAVGEIRGWIPFIFQCEQITVADREGVWLAVEHIQARISPLELLRGHVAVSNLAIESIHLARFPVSQEVDAEPHPLTLRLISQFQTVTIHRIAVGRIVLDPPVLGKSAEYTLRGGLRLDSTDEPLHAELVLQPVSGVQSEIDLQAWIKGYPPRLVIDADIQDEENGLLLTLLGLRDAGNLHARLRGEGPLSDWRGELQAGIERYGSTDLHLVLQAETGIALQAEGEIQPVTTQIPVELQSLAGDILRLAISARWDGASLWMLDHLRLETQGPVIELSGDYDSETHSLASRAIVHIGDFSFLNRLTGLNLAGAAVLSATISGPFQQPEADIQIHMDKPRVEDVAMEHLSLSLQAAVLEPYENTFPPLQLTATGHGTDLIYHATPAFRENHLSWAFHGVAGPTTSITIQQMDLRGTSFETRIVGTADYAIPSVSLTVDGQLSSMRHFAKLVNVPLDGSLRFQADLEGNAGTHSLVSTFNGSVKNLKGLSGLPAALTGSAVDWNGRVILNQGEELTLANFQLKSAALQVTASATADLSKRSLGVTWKFNLPQLARFSLWPGHPITGSLSGDGQAGGVWPDLAFETGLQSGDLTLDGISLGRAAASLRAKNLAQHPQGDLRFTLNNDEHSLALTTEYLYQHPRMELNGFSLNSPSLEIHGDAWGDLQSKLVQGRLRGGAQDLAKLGEWFQEPLRGALTFEAEMNSIQGRQGFRLRGSASGLESRWGRLDAAQWDARLEDVFTAPHGTLAFSATALQRDVLMVDSFNLTVQREKSRSLWELDGHGTWHEAFQFAAKGALEISKVFALEFHSFDAAYGKIPIVLDQPARLEWRGNNLILDWLRLRAESTTLSSSGQMDPGRIAWELTLDGFPLEWLSRAGWGEISGNLESRVHISGSPGTPILQGRVSGSHVRLSSSALEPGPEASLEAKVSYALGTLRTDMQVTHLVDKPITATLEIPLDLSLSPFRFLMIPSGAVQGHIAGEADMAVLPDLLSLADQKLAGRLAAQFTISGTVEQPVVSGALTVEKGSYDHLEFGTVLRDLHFRIEANGDKLRVSDGRFTDGGSGRGIIGGQIQMLPDFPFSLEVILKQATLVRRDDVTATISGSVVVSGNPRQPVITGSLTVDPAEVRIDEPLPVEIRHMEIITIEEPNPGSPPPPPPAFLSPGIQADLGLQLDFPNRLFVRGRGLDSEWQGNLTIKGPLQKPVIQGQFSIVRGNFQFFGNRLNLPSGTVALTGAYPPDPFLNLTAETTKKNTSFILGITGPASSPEFILRSNPPLPSDEVLSYLLFGRRIHEITPLQAIQFAQAANTLRGGRGVFDMMGKTRSLLGLAQLELRQSDEEGLTNTMVGIGKYLTDDIYVDFQRGFQNDSSRVMVEIQLTPNIAIESEMSLNAASGIGIVWKLDF
ncbi:MAG: hypothetical protein HPY51_07010 [Candidatus Omnitrophica bacterium]|nr:hypothetical protein [Candidatus Omnitrophota bacterium]